MFSGPQKAGISSHQRWPPDSHVNETYLGSLLTAAQGVDHGVVHDFIHFNRTA